MLKSLSLAERMYLEEDRMPFYPGTKWDRIRDRHEKVLQDLIPLIVGLQNPEVKDAIQKWHAIESKQVAKGYEVVHWEGLENILNNHPELTKQFREGCPAFAEHLRAREAYAELEKRNGNSAQGVVQDTRKKVLSSEERRKLIMSNPFNGPLLQALEAKKNGKNGQ